jgi:tetratricopeptide (TPR) repeat protein
MYRLTRLLHCEKFSETQILQQSHASASLILQTLYGLTRSEEDLLRAAVQARLSGNWTAAQCLFQEIFASFGQKYGSCMEGGLCELAMGNNIQAEELFAAAYQINQNAHAILWRGVALRRLGKYEEALDSLKLALRLDASLPSIHNEIGQCFEALGNYRSAIQSYRDFPTNGSPESRTFALNRLGLCYLKIDDSNALSALLDSQIYREHMNTSYAIASYVLWCLHLHRQVDDEYIISREQSLTP